jgi:hypothetical protein
MPLPSDDNNFFTRVAKIQKELEAPKNQINTFGNYKYRSCEDILGAVKPHLDGLLLYLSDTIVNIGERYYIESTAKITDGIKSLEAKGLARETENKKGMDDSQITGAASSYARKYALNGLFAIDDEKDADTKDNRGADTKPAPRQKETSKPAGKKEYTWVKIIPGKLIKEKETEKSVYAEFSYTEGGINIAKSMLKGDKECWSVPDWLQQKNKLALFPANVPGKNHADLQAEGHVSALEQEQIEREAQLNGEEAPF